MRWRGGARIATAAAAGVLVAGCELVGVSTPSATFEQGAEHLPGPGVVEITGDPSVAPSPLTVEYVLSDGSIAPAPETINAGDAISLSTWGNPGLQRLRVNGTVCAGSYSIESDRRTEVTLRVGPGGCQTVVKGIGPLAS